MPNLKNMFGGNVLSIIHAFFSEYKQKGSTVNEIPKDKTGTLEIAERTVEKTVKLGVFEYKVVERYVNKSPNSLEEADSLEKKGIVNEKF